METIKCGDTLYLYTDGTPSRRLCGECAASHPERGFAQELGCGETLERPTQDAQPTE